MVRSVRGGADVGGEKALRGYSFHKVAEEVREGGREGGKESVCVCVCVCVCVFACLFVFMCCIYESSLCVNPPVKARLNQIHDAFHNRTGGDDKERRKRLEWGLLLYR